MKFDLTGFAKARILILGDVMLDKYIWGNVSRISPEAPVPVVAIRKTTNVLGGAGNVASNISELGCKVKLIGISGEDEQNIILNDILKKQKIESLLIKGKQRVTITKTRIIAQKQQLLRMDDEDIKPLSEELKKKVIEKYDSSVQGSDAVIISDYGKGFFATPGLCEYIIEDCNNKNIPVLVDPKGIEWDKYANATCVTPNTSEFQDIMGYNNYESDTEKLIADIEILKKKLNLKNLLITRGAQGMCLLDSQNISYIIPTVAKEVFDVSGAGDTVISTITAGVVSGLSFIEASKLANIAAGVVVGKIGTQPICIEELKKACYK